jgi:hypothetical protein
MLEVLEVLLLPSGGGHFGYSSCTWPGLWKCQFLLFSTTEVKEEILKKNRQEDVGMVKVLWHLISSSIKIYINIFFFWIGYILKIGGKLLLSHCGAFTSWKFIMHGVPEAKERAIGGGNIPSFCALMVPHTCGIVFHYLIQAFHNIWGD